MEHTAAAQPPLPITPTRREHERVDAEFEVTVASDSNFYVGFSENISEGGLFVATYETRPVGSRLELQFTLPGIPEPQRVVGEVRWLRTQNAQSDTPPGMGLRFVEILPETRALIERFVHKRAPLFYDDEG